ncbi:MAG: tRNA uridine-5-carboxymethylaminomethyl(34) synthesis GTPase MnmE, partial [Butyrivibrio sp.]|nr:tRNA uridine-5-carboxymethylaminomethyl(34) synthesis GTPase MnmE [Butyrivibrio sp.]
GNRIFRTPKGKQILINAESHRIYYGYIVGDSDGQGVLDEVMVSVMRAPRSFTAEDTVEINCHGGVLVMRKILELVCRSGARLAEAGEFTKRAFLNGRIDLSKAEAVMDVIHSQNELALKSSVSQLRGSLFDRICELRKGLIYEIAFIESALDDPEHISLEGYPESLHEKIEGMNQQIFSLIATSENGKLIKEGISTVIIGKPNVGKSSLLNRMLGEERAIVTDIAGTTRDVLQESINLHGISLNLIDTAGIRYTEDIIEKIGVEKAKKYAEDADLILCVIDSSVDLEESDREILSEIFALIQNKKTIILLNKTDLQQAVDEKMIEELLIKAAKRQKAVYNNITDFDAGQIYKNVIFVRTSTKDGSGMDELEEAVKKLFFSGMIQSNSELVITNIRHKKALENAYESLNLVLRSIEDSMPEDFYSIDLMNAYASLGLIIGEEVNDDLMDEIFSKFCMGK